MPKKIAIVGAGVSGLAAAFRLSSGDNDIEVFEKSRGLSGRAASRSKNGTRYDYGANYFKVESNELARLIFEDLPTDNLCRITGDVGTFDKDGHFSEGDPTLNASAKWSYQGGISTLGKLLASVAELEVLQTTQIVRIEKCLTKWDLVDDEGRRYEDYDAVLLTPPAPQTIDLLRASELGDEANPEQLIGALSEAKYHSQFSVMMNFQGSVTMPGNSYALINTDREHKLAWVSIENSKGGHVPKGESLLVAQMSPTWSVEHYDDPATEIIAQALKEVRAVVDSNLPDPLWSDTQRWRYAHPHTAVNHDEMRAASPPGVFISGDALVGKGRIPGAIETGLEAASLIEGYLSSGTIE